MSEPIRIAFTGGGSAGHVTPNVAIIQALQAKGHTLIFYVGSRQGIERSLVSSLNIPYYPITTGKLRRYWSWENFLTPWQLLIGIWQSFLLCYRLKPAVLFSKGGFVALPVVIGAWLNRIPVVVHESDRIPGLANRLSFPFAKKICVTFPSTVRYVNNKKKIQVTGVPIREFLYHGDRSRGLDFCRFNKEKPVLLVMAGGLGSVIINETIRRLIAPLTKQFQVIHLCGKGKCDPSLSAILGYRQFEYIQEEFADILACADLVMSRAGATSLYELLVLAKPHILLPLSKQASRGDQMDNAAYFSELGFSRVLYPEVFSDKKLLQAIVECYRDLDQIKRQLVQFKKVDSVGLIVQILREVLQKSYPPKSGEKKPKLT